MMIVLVLTLAVFFFALRLYITPGFKAEEFEQLYDQLCADIQSGGDGEELFKAAKRQMRKAGNKPEVLFFFQFAGIYAGKLNPPKNLLEMEVPVREAVLEGRFDDAMDLVNHLVLETDEMTLGRGQAWGKLVRELRIRWENDCRKPATETPVEAT